MKPSTAPSKEQVRSFMEARKTATTPPEPPDVIREMLDWHLIPATAGR